MVDTISRDDLVVDQALIDELDSALQPNAIAEAGEAGGPGFVLAKSEWIAIQSYVTNALALPTTDDEFRNSIHADEAFDLSDFKQLISCYQLINQHTTVWNDETFPASVDLAGRIYQYGSQKVPSYYPPIVQLADKLVADPDDTKVQQQLKAVLESLQNTAQGFADEAKGVADAVHEFSTQTEQDQITLVGESGDAGLQKYYQDKYGDASEEVKKLTGQIADQQKIFDAAMEEYNHDVVVAATTPTYAWVFPFGTIAAAVVAGVYGDKAVKALNAAEAAAAQIKTLNEKLQRNALLMIYVNNTTKGVTTIATKLAAALPAIQKVEGVWRAMSSDLGRIVEIIDQDIRKALPIIQSLGVDQAMLAWQQVAAAANAYRLNAYIKEEVGAGPSAESAKLRALFLGEFA